jgi:hypothetical protein
VRHSGVGSCFASVMLVVLTSCGGSDGPGMTEPDPPRATTLSASPSAVTLSFVGQTSTLVGIILDQNGQPFGGTISWQSDNPSVVTASTTGLLTAVQNGTATVTASSGSLSSTVTVTVQQVATLLEVASGGDQSATVGQALAELVVVRVQDAGGSVVVGANVRFVVSAGGGTVGSASVQTDAQGLASTTWTLGTMAAQQQIDVSVEGSASVVLQVFATGLTAAAVALVKSSGDMQSGAIGQPVPEAIVAQLQDEFGNGVPGQNVTFVVTSGGGTVSSATATTGATGLAATIWTMGPTLGSATLAATATGLTPVVFSATAVAPSPDLVAGAMSVNPASLTTLETFTVTVPVTNGGTSTPGRSFSVQLLVDGVEAATQTVAPIAPAGTSNVAFASEPLAAGLHTLRTVVDVDGVVTESDEGNNTAQLSVNVVAQTQLEVGTPITDLSAAKDVELLFAFQHTQDGGSIEFRLSDAEITEEEDADIYVSLGSPPAAPLGFEYLAEPSLGTCRGITPDTEETCLINDAQTGTYHVLIHAFTNFSGVTLTVSTGHEVLTFDIELDFVSPASSRHHAVFEAAAAQWERILPLDVSDLPFDLEPQEPGSCGVPFLPALDESIDDIKIFVKLDSIDGPGSVLAHAGFCIFRSLSKLPVVGFMKFDTADLAELEANLRLEPVIVHEMGHVLGIGTAWGPDLADLRRNSSVENPGVDTYFDGPLAIASFDAAGGTAYTGEKVPVENSGVVGQADGHWRESVLGSELMTPLLDFAPKLSAISVQSLADIGYPVDVSNADPFVIPALAAAFRAGPVIDLSGDVWIQSIVEVDARGKVVRVIRR